MKSVIAHARYRRSLSSRQPAAPSRKDDIDKVLMNGETTQITAGGHTRAGRRAIPPDICGEAVEDGNGEE